MLTSSALLRHRWRVHLERGLLDAPLISPLFVAEQGPAVQIADIRDPGEAIGVLGYVPGSCFPGIQGLESLQRDAEDPPLVLVSATGNSAAVVARRLELAGQRHVAAMQGGVTAWRGLGLSTSRDPEGITTELLAAPEVQAAGGPLTADLVRAHIGDPRSVRWIKLPALISHGRLSCIDGRDERGVIGAPGGNGGEFLLTLAAIEATTGEALSPEAVEAGLLSHIDTFGNFHVHTDVTAFEALIADLETLPELQETAADLSGIEEWSAWLRNAPAELHEDLLARLLEPAHIGCGHIRLMLERSDRYGIRRELVESFLRTFYRVWWAGAPELSLSVLPGDHSEGAVVNVRLAAETWGLSRVPLISPACAGRQIFVNHPDISAYLRHRTVELLTRENGPLAVGPALATQLQDAFDELAARQLSATAEALAKDLPIFDVVFSGDGAFEVRPAG